MKRTDLSNLGGLKFTQNRLAFMQESFTEPLFAFAKLCGEKTILYGVEVNAGNVTNGWIVYGGEPIRFVGGSVGTQVIITETAVSLVFGNSTVHDVHFEKTATCGAVGNFPFSDLTPLLELQNIWMAGDIKEKVVDTIYEAANFDVNGFGINKEKGWRKLSSVYAEAAGAVSVNKKDGDTEFGEVGNFGGEKVHNLTVPEMPSHHHKFTNAGDGAPDNNPAGWVGGNNLDGRTPIPNCELHMENTGGDLPHNNLQPYFVTLKLIKL